MEDWSRGRFTEEINQKYSEKEKIRLMKESKTILQNN